MSSDEVEVTMSSAYMTVSQEMLDDAQDFSTLLRQSETLTAEQWAERRAALAAARAAERAAAQRVPLTLTGLLDKLGFSDEYAEHLMQPYCECDWDSEGWYHCPHAQDLGIEY